MSEKKRWNYRPSNASVDELKRSLNISEILAKLLVNRGLKDVEAAKKFLKPSLADLQDPCSISDLEKGADLLVEAIKNKEKIVIYGDYDVDGITATAILIKVLRDLEGNISYYIPHRYHEGYSLNLEAIDKLAEDSAKWMVTVDCGISNPKEIKYARQKGIKVIVTDHHNPPAVLPEAEAIINPKLGESTAPYYSLSGVGVAYKLAQIIHKKFNKSPQDIEKFLALVALGTVADMVPLIGENRILTFYGLKQLANATWPGIEMLKKIAKLKKEITSRSIGFVLGPRINAAGRLEDAGLAVDLLIADSKEAAKPLANKLNYLNVKRQRIGSKILEDALRQINENKNILEQKVLILSSEDWHPGVIGIVASQLVRKYNRPAVLISLEGKTARGSIRSPEGIGIFQALQECQDLFINYGGHQEAAGFELSAKNIPEFTKRYLENLTKAITPEMLVPKLTIDLKLKGSDISSDLANDLKTLAPFGQGNALPTFSADTFELEDFRQVGDGSHLKFTFRDGEKLFDGIGFGLGEYSKQLLEHQGPLEIAFSLEINEWNGRKKTQLSLHDLRLKK